LGIGPFDRDNGIKAYSNANELQLTLNGIAQGKMKNGDYRLQDAAARNLQMAGIPVANVFFWKTPLKPGRNVVEVTDGHGHSDRMIVYQEPANTLDSTALIQDLKSSNAANPAHFIDRSVESQGPVYTDVDGSSDNTFDILPKEVEGASWIATRRLSDPNLQTDLAFRINPTVKGATIFVLFSTGDYPMGTLKQPDLEIRNAADRMRESLAVAGFKPTGTTAVWRDHMLNRAYAELWIRMAKHGEAMSLPGQCLDSVVMLRGIDSHK
jgi:beta-galactosidase